MTDAVPLMSGAHVGANGIRQHYLRYGGKGEPVIVVPGITSPAATWGFVGARLGARYDTYVLDVRGRGLSSAGPNLDYSLDAYAKDVDAFAAALGLSSYRLVGHSMGGRIAAKVASCHGGPVSHVALIDPPLTGPGRKAYVQPLAFYLKAIREAQAGTLDFARARASYPLWTEEQVRQRIEWLPTCDETAIARTHAGFSDEEIHTELLNIMARLLLMVAGKGGVIDAGDIAEVLALQPATIVKTIAGAGHMIPFEKPEEFFTELDRFLESPPSQA